MYFAKSYVFAHGKNWDCNGARNNKRKGDYFLHAWGEHTTRVFSVVVANMNAPQLQSHMRRWIYMRVIVCVALLCVCPAGFSITKNKRRFLFGGSVHDSADELIVRSHSSSMCPCGCVRCSLIGADNLPQNPQSSQFPAVWMLKGILSWALYQLFIYYQHSRWADNVSISIGVSQ